MSANGTESGPWIVEVPSHGTVPAAPDKNRVGRLVWMLDEAEWSAVHFTAETDSGWQPFSERPPCPPTVFDSRAEAEAKLRHTQRRAEVFAAATSTGLSPYLMAGRVSEAATLAVKSDFEAEVQIEKRAAKLEELVKAEQRATARRESEEAELAQIRADTKAEFARLRQEAGGSDWASLGGIPKVQHRRRADGSEAFRARVSGEASPTFATLEEAVRWRDARSGPDEAPMLVGPAGRGEGSRPAA